MGFFLSDKPSELLQNGSSLVLPKSLCKFPLRLRNTTLGMELLRNALVQGNDLLLVHGRGTQSQPGESLTPEFVHLNQARAANTPSPGRNLSAAFWGGFYRIWVAWTRAMPASTPPPPRGSILGLAGSQGVQ